MEYGRSGVRIDSSVKHIALVDDDSLDRLATRRALGSLKGVVFDEYSSAEVCLEVIAVDPPAIIITDIYMPRMDGLELISAVRKLDSQVPVIALSGKSGESLVDYLEIAERFGAVSVVRKDQVAACLSDVVARILKLQFGPADWSE